MLHDMDQYDWLNNIYMAAVDGIVSRRGLGIDVHHKDQHNKSKLVLVKLLLSL